MSPRPRIVLEPDWDSYANTRVGEAGVDEGETNNCPGERGGEIGVGSWI